ncbi:hypothetical protein [Hymenobacter nivis]|uniref:hypothetical protein n=1 Tax=Hymenobacter nivis TaxID=1850093 RepID=UPI00137623B6|nr:hypothetical protein [Hymenobacter nivis]
MKQAIGAFILLLGAGLAGLLALRIWGVAAVGLPTLLRSGATLVVLALALVGLVVVWFAFFNDPAAGYNVRAGRRAHPKADAKRQNFSGLR